MIAFKHFKSNHCENGAIKNLFHHYGWDLSEPLIFGIGSGLFFMHVPYIKNESLPLTIFRTYPVSIFKNISKRLHFKSHYRYFLSKKKSMRVLDRLLEQNIPVGVVVGLAKLNYFPVDLRGSFNGHHIVVYGKIDGKYQISDSFPVRINGLEELTYDELLENRYSQGNFSPHGRIFYITSLPELKGLDQAIIKGIKHTCKLMLDIPLKYFGTNGIAFLGRDIKKWSLKLSDRKLISYLRQIVRVAEETGTGGSGFRFIYASFLKEAAQILQYDQLNILSQEMHDIATDWQILSVEILRVCKNRTQSDDSLDIISDMLINIADKEKMFFTKLRATINNKSYDK